MVYTGLFLFFLSTITTSIGSPYYEATENKISWQESVLDYPNKIAEKLLDQLEGPNENFTLKLKLLDMSKNKIRADKNITYTNLCNSTKQKIFPQGVKINDEEYYMLNPRSRVIQMIEFERCTSSAKGKSCQHLESVQIGYSTVCVQEYISRIIYVMPKNEPTTLIKKSIPIESCCSCYYK